MMMDCGYYYPDHSALFRALERYFRSRGVTSEAKLGTLRERWIRRKGYRYPSSEDSGR